MNVNRSFHLASQLLVLVFIVFSCESKQVDNNKSADLTKTNKDSLEVDLEIAPDIATQFRSFRDGVFQNKKEAVKPFFDFPILNTGNEIWYHITDGDYITVNYPVDKKVPFLETDFDTHFSQLFPKLFIKCLLKVKSEQLFQSGSFDTPVIMDGATEHRIFATFDKVKGDLDLNWHTETPTTDHDDWDSEYSVNYGFKIDENGFLKFVEIRLAG